MDLELVTNSYNNCWVRVVYNLHISFIPSFSVKTNDCHCLYLPVYRMALRKVERVWLKQEEETAYFFNEACMIDHFNLIVDIILF